MKPQENNGNKRKLASIRQISAIKEIDGADKICAYQVDGWWVVDQKERFKEGDLCVYFEIDSVLPVRPEFEFLRKGCYVKKDWLVSELNPTGEGFRLKTIKLRGQISQGLVVPLVPFSFMGKNFQGIMTLDGTHQAVELDDDVSEALGVVKWDPPLPATLSGRARGNFPSFIPKTDQERIQNIKPETLEKFRTELFEITLKLDGSSMTAFAQNDRVGVCSRNLELDYENDPDTTFARVFRESGLAAALRSGKYDGLAIQGELMGPGIQGNRENLREHMFYVFDVYDINRGVYLDPMSRHKLVARLYSEDNVRIEHCPVLVEAYDVCRKTKEQILDMARGPSMVHPVREGLVFKCITDPSFSFKAISNDYLLQGGE